jgi:hypothetical protein
VRPAASLALAIVQLLRLEHRNHSMLAAVIVTERSRGYDRQEGTR